MRGDASATSIRLLLNNRCKREQPQPQPSTAEVLENRHTGEHQPLSY